MPGNRKPKNWPPDTRRGWILSLAASVVFLSCKKPDAGAFTLDCHILPQPVRVGPASIQIGFHRGSGEPVPDAKVSLEADMSHAGMQPRFAEASQIGSGAYKTSINFDMPGDWTLLIRASLPDGRQINAERRFTVEEK